MEVSDITVAIAVIGFMIGLGMWTLYFPWRFQMELTRFLQGDSKYSDKVADFLTVILDSMTKSNNPDLNRKIKGHIKKYIDEAAPTLADAFLKEAEKRAGQAQQQGGMPPQMGMMGGQGLDIVGLINLGKQFGFIK